MKIYSVGTRKVRQLRLSDTLAWLLQEAKALSGESLSEVIEGIKSLGKRYRFSLKGKDLYRFTEEFCLDRQIDRDLWVPIMKKGQSRIPKATRPTFKKKAVGTITGTTKRPQPAKRPHAQLSIRFITVSYQINLDSVHQMPKHALFAVAYERQTGGLFYALVSEPFTSSRENTADAICSTFKPKLFENWLDDILGVLGDIPIADVFLPNHSAKSGLQGLIPHQFPKSWPPKPDLEKYTVVIELITTKLKPPTSSFCPLLPQGHLRLEGQKRFGDWLRDIKEAVINYNRFGRSDPPVERMRRALQLWN